MMSEENKNPEDQDSTLEAPIEETIEPVEEPATKPEEVAQPEPRTVPTRDDLTMAALAHASILLTFLIGVGSGGLGVVLGVLVPLAIWYSYRDKSAYTAKQAIYATAYQVACILSYLALAVVGVILVVVGWTVSGALTVVLVGLCLMPFVLLITVLLVIGLILLPLVQLVYGLYAAYEIYQGRDFRYRWVADWVDQQNWS